MHTLVPLKYRLRRDVIVDSGARLLTDAAHVKLSSRSRVSVLSGERSHTRAQGTGRSAERLEAIMLKSSRVRELLHWGQYAGQVLSCLNPKTVIPEH